LFWGGCAGPMLKEGGGSPIGSEKLRGKQKRERLEPRQSEAEMVGTVKNEGGQDTTSEKCHRKDSDWTFGQGRDQLRRIHLEGLESLKPTLVCGRWGKWGRDIWKERTWLIQLLEGNPKNTQDRVKKN